MTKTKAVKLRVTLYLMPVALFCLSIGFVIGENVAPRLVECHHHYGNSWDNYSAPKNKDIYSSFKNPIRKDF